MIASWGFISCQRHKGINNRVKDVIYRLTSNVSPISGISSTVSRLPGFLIRRYTYEKSHASISLLAFCRWLPVFSLCLLLPFSVRQRCFSHRSRMRCIFTGFSMPKLMRARDSIYAAGKHALNLNVGEPRTVRMIYFLPNDRPFRQEVVDAMKDVMPKVQTFFADQMEAHGQKAA